ncbi:AfsR/SARP family transcriptional regulator [Dietzia alimentaria]|uniref:AfsR/SARP family transcriptional regulator n=1 Tax=Dietzia alimentaria TaxID=665550 RepID=UPI00029A9544|nr:AfsR/SARP family transcriptional regulator [Dietzia alimentaria]
MPTVHQPRPRLELLGAVQATLDGDPLPVRGHKQQVLLSRLALAGGKPVTVDTLIDDLWEQSPPADAVSALQVHVSRLRSALSVEIELVNGSAYRLASNQVRTDVQEFITLCEQARARAEAGEASAAVRGFEQAFRLWRGPALGELSRDNALRAASLRLNEGRERAIDDWVAVCLDAGRAEEVVDELRSTLDRDPLQEHRWRQFILALHRCGRHGDALDAHRRAREVFIEELGVEPSRMLSDVHAELRRLDAADLNSTDLDSTAVSPAEPHPVAREPADLAVSGLVGRRDEFAILAEAWRDAHHGLHLVTISGEAGVGKSRLASEFAARASAAGGTVLTGRCDPAIGSPFQPFAQILAAHFAEDVSQTDAAALNPRLVRHLPGLARVAPELVSVFSPVTRHATSPPAEDRGHGAYESVAAWLSVISGPAPVLLVVDDLHWADAETLHLLRHILHSPRPIRALLVVALRDRQVSSAPIADSIAHTLFPELLRQSETVSHLPLRRLNRDETATLLARESVDRDPPPGSVIEQVRAASGGNPLFIVELARQWRTSPSPSSSSPPGTATVTPGLRHVIGSRVDALPRRTRTFLRWASVVGAEFDVAILTVLAHRAGGGPGGWSDDDTANIEAEIAVTTADAVHAQLIEPIGGVGRFTFSHQIVRTTLYESLPFAERSALHGLIADTLENTRVQDAPMQHHVLAHHLRRSDLPDGQTRAARHLLAAGRDALERGASTNALHLLQDALQLPIEDPELCCDLLINLGTAQSRTGRSDHRQTLLDAAELAHRLADRDRVIAAVLANSRGWFSDAATIDHERVAGIETALAMCGPTDSPARAPLLAAWATENTRDPGVRAEVLAASAESLRLAEELGDHSILALSLDRRYTVLYALFEQPAECLRLAERLMDLSRISGDKATRLSASICLAQASMRFGGFHVADRYLQQAAQLAEVLERPAHRWLVAGWLASRTAMRGQVDRAEVLMRENLELGLQSDQGDALTWFTGQLFTIRLLQGRLPEMLDDVTDQVAAAAEAIPAWRAAMAVVLANTGGRRDAEAVLEELAVDSFAALPRDIVWLNGMSYLAMVCETLKRPDIAESLYRALAPYSGMMATNGTIDSGPVDLRLGALARVTGNSTLARQHLRSAELMCRRIDARVWADQASRLIAAL